jgi:hypothetical protein
MTDADILLSAQTIAKRLLEGDVESRSAHLTNRDSLTSAYRACIDCEIRDMYDHLLTADSYILWHDEIPTSGQIERWLQSLLEHGRGEV